MKKIIINGPDKSIELSNSNPISFILGPCVIESKEKAFEAADFLKKLSEKLNFNFIYKSSFDKANRSSINSFRGPGLDKGLEILASVREEFRIPVLTDVHNESQIKYVSEVVDYIQTPAFLCRQTDFIVSVSKSMKPVNIKKGQFLSPEEMANVAKKALSTGNDNISLCERGTTFGYNNLVVDFRGLSIMKQSGLPIIFDATHSVQLPGAKGNSSGGDRKFVSNLALAAATQKIAGIFIETHPFPDDAPCDGPNMVAFENLEELMIKILKIDNLVKN